MMQHQDDMPFRGEDIPLIKLKKSQFRKIDSKAFSRIRTSIEKIGMIEPLHVSPSSDGDYIILEGEHRFDALVELGYETAPCIIREDMDFYTANYQVNHLSPLAATKMIKKAMEVVDGQLIADIFGLKKIVYRLPESLLNRLHPTLVKACDKGTITRACARELAEVVPVRQLEIFAMMQHAKNFRTQFAKQQIRMTPKKQWQSTRKISPWMENKERKKSLGTKLQTHQTELDQYVKSYRGYASNLMSTVIHCRAIISNKAIEKYLKINMLPIYEEIKAIIESELIEKKGPR
jgi:hypothetical protein